ncbi:MAG: colicin import membrane protein [Chitinophagales bacterium]|jgi:colicin import membrane protein
MVEELLKYPKVLGLSFLFHLVIIVAIVINFQFFDKPKLIQTGTQVKTIQAKMIESKQLEKNKQVENTQKADQRENELKKKSLEEKAKELKQKKETEKKQRAKAQKEKLEKQKKAAQAREKASIKKKKDAKEREERKAQEKLETEKKAAKEKAAIEKLKQEADRRRQAEEEQKRKEAELKVQLDAEEASRRLSLLKDDYSEAIKQKVERNWLRPQQSVKIESCEVKVEQGPSGIIMDVTFGDCSGGTNAYRASIENAVYKAEPLPSPSDPALFERDIIFIFSPK